MLFSECRRQAGKPMEILWFFPLTVGMLPFAIVCCLWQRRIATSWPRRLLASLLLGIPCAPVDFTSHVVSAVIPVLVLFPLKLQDVSAERLLLLAQPIFITTLIIFSVWSLALGFLRCMPRNSGR